MQTKFGLVSRRVSNMDASVLVQIDPEFQRLIPPLRPDELAQLEANILRDGCLEPLSIWRKLLLDGHKRLEICQQHNKPFAVKEITLSDRDHAKAWITQRQLGRRNLTDDQRAMVANDRREILSQIARRERAKIAGKTGGRNHPKDFSLEAELARKLKAGKRIRSIVAQESKLPEKKIRTAQEITRADRNVADMVRSGAISLVEGKRLTALPAQVRSGAIAAVKSGTDVCKAVRAAKRADYNGRVAAAKPKPLEGTYRIFYADNPWKYVGLNKCDEHGHAERHYDCLDDVQLCNYRPGNGSRLVRDMADENAVLFLWVPSPMLKRCFAIIDAWGFEYKASFVWDKVKHMMGHYNSVRHELLLICTRGSCKPDIPKLIDSVQVIERRGKHSQKPEEFYSIIEGMYDHGRKLELFARSRCEGWDADGNELVAKGSAVLQDREPRPGAPVDVAARPGAAASTGLIDIAQVNAIAARASISRTTVLAHPPNHDDGLGRRGTL